MKRKITILLIVVAVVAFGVYWGNTETSRNTHFDGLGDTWLSR
ncbi:MAG: hypothetical protein ACJA1Y_000262 [Burkholderiaceae bacterium]|jgi:hypothetical protein